jgi:hypothetical protein
MLRDLVFVQFTDPNTGDMTMRIPATQCRACNDIVIGDVSGRDICSPCHRARTKGADLVLRMAMVDEPEGAPL